MKKLTAIATAVGMALAASTASANPIYIDYTGTAYFDETGSSADGDQITSSYNQLGVEAYTTTIFTGDNDGNGYVSAGDSFVDYGVGYFSSVIPDNGDNEGLNEEDLTIGATTYTKGSELTFWWDDLTGYVSGDYTPIYTGGTVHVQLDDYTTGLTSTLSTAYTTDTFTADTTDNDTAEEVIDNGGTEFADGTRVMDMIVTSGGINPQKQSLILTGYVDMSNVPAGYEDIFHFSQTGDSFGDMALAQLVIGWNLDVNSDNWAQNMLFNETKDFGNGDVNVARHQSDHNGSVEFIPEPGTLAILSTGLLGLGFGARRRSRKG